MTKKRIFLDCDDVIADFVPSFLKYYNEKYQTEWTEKDINNYNLYVPMNTTENIIQTQIMQHGLEGKILNLPLVKGVKENIEKLINNGNEIYIITARLYAFDTVQWLQHHQIPFTNMYCTRDKAPILKMMGADWFVDDNLTHLLSADANGIKSICYAKPWNKQLPKKNNNIKRVNNWDKIYKIITGE